MKKIIPLIIALIIIIIIGVKMYEKANNMVEEATLNDLKTNMLLIQAKLIKCVEEVNFQKANVKDEARIAEIKNEHLKGSKIISNEEVKRLAENTKKIDSEKIDEYYYLSEEDLKTIGITNLSIEENGYFIIKYNIEEITLDVLNTKGYKGVYTLEELKALEK